MYIVLCGQTAFFHFSLWWQKKGSGDLTIGFACDKITRFWQALIADDEPKRGVKYLWDYVSQLYIRINSCDQYKRDMYITILPSTPCSNTYKSMLCTILKGPNLDVVKDEL